MGADTSSLKGAANTQGGKLNWMSNFSLGYIKKLKERFEYANDDFTLDEAALKNYFKCSDKEVSELFEFFDSDGSGKIDSYELTCALGLLADSDLSGKAELIFNLYDYDGNKFITRDELVILMTNVLSALNAMKGLKAPTIPQIEAKTDQFFAGADTNGDDKITLKEFKDYITRDKDIIEVLLSSNVAKREDLGTDFGSSDSTVPSVDPDLEAECNPKALQYSQKKQNIKAGVDPSLNEDGEVDEGLFHEEGVEGDQFMAVKPWMGVVKNSVPTNYKPNKRDAEAPDATLQLEYIHGYRCHDARNNLRYTSTGEVVYHAAAAGIVLNQKTNTQRFFIQHTDDVHCLALDPTGKLVATGEIGPKPVICVWNNETMECVSRIQGTLTKGIKNLAFSPDGKLLAASAFDDEHCIAIYQLGQKLKPGQTIAPIATGKGTRAAILSLGFNPQGNTVVATCVKEVDFFTFNQGLIQKKVGTGWTNNQQSVLCQAFLGDTLYTGLFDGSLVAWAGNAIKNTIKAHTDGVHALYARQNNAGLISGGGDGLITFWSPSPTGLQQVKQLDLKLPEVKSMLPKVRSVCENATTGQVLVGTRGGEIVEFGGPKPLILMRSHYEGELWGLTPHPIRQEFVTVGQDSVMAIWDVKTRKQKRFGKLEQAANVAAFSNNGVLLAIGYTNGAFHVLEPDNKFTLKANIKNRKEAISDMKFNPQDTLLAVAAHDSCIILYDVVNNFTKLKIMRGHPSTVAHMDFSLDGTILMSNCTSYNILFFDTKTGKHNPSGASAYKNESWASWTCTLGWPVQGIWPAFANGTDINSVDRSPDGIVLATADDFGKVKLFKYPNPVEKTANQQYQGHSSHVTNVRFLKQAPYLISTGGEDKCIFQWKYFLDKESAQQSEQLAKAPAAKIVMSSIEDDIAEPPKLRGPPQGEEKKKAAGPIMDEGGLFVEEDMGEGDQRMAVLAFKGQVDASTPDIYKKPSAAMGAKPNGNLKLKYAHGFRSFDTRGNLKYVDKDHVAFTTAALGVILNKTANEQNFFNKHDEDVVSMAIHPGKDIIATGQMAAKGKAKLIDIFVWQISTGEVLAHLNNFHRGAIRKLEFSPAGDKLLSIGEDEKNSVAVYDWANQKLLCSSPVAVAPDKVMDACWKDETEFATIGLQHVKFFNLQGINITMSKGLYGAQGVTPMISCAFAFQEKTFLTGTQTGDLVVWNGRSVGKSFKQHTDALWQIINVQNRTLVITGGNDGQLVTWDKTFVPKQKIDLTTMSKFPTGVRALDYHEQTKTILVGTRGAEIIEVNGTNGAKIKTLINGHFQGTPKAELWGCAVHPTEQIFATCGADKTIRLWKDNQMIQASDLFPEDLTALDWSSNGQFIIAGDRAGNINLIDIKTLKSLGSSPGKLAGQKEPWVEDLKISPDNKIVAFGTHGGRSFIDLVSVIDGKKLQKIVAVNLGLSSALLHLDWAQDSQSIMLVSQAYELMWMDVTTKKQIPASSAKGRGDDYATFTNIFGWQVKGIWPPFSDFTDVNSTCRSNARTILATADDFGKVKLFKYPCVVEKGAQFDEYNGHSSHVTKVKFTANDTYLVTTGGHDKTVLIWETDFSLAAGPAKKVPVIEEEEEKGQQVEEDDFEMQAFAAPKQPDITKKINANQLQKKAGSRAPAPAIKQPDPLDEASPFEIADIGHGDEFMAAVPWRNQIRAPEEFKKAAVNSAKPPQINLDLEWVHGYRSHDSRNNIGVLLDQTVAYQAAGLGVIYHPQSHTQRHFNMHTDDVSAIAFSSDKRFIATGEMGAKPMIYVWDSQTMHHKKAFKGHLTCGIQSLSFSPSGKFLAAVANDNDYTVAVFNVETGVLLKSAKGDINKIVDICMRDDQVFATSGVNHFKEWTLTNTELISKPGAFKSLNKAHIGCVLMGDSFLSGAITGELYCWRGASIAKNIKLHEGSLYAITVTSNYVLTGGKDCKVNVLQVNTFVPVYSFSLSDPKLGFASIQASVRALALNDSQDTLYIGTLGSEIYQVPVNFGSKQVQKAKKVVNGHYCPSFKWTNEVWGLEVHPTQEKYITVSDDATLRVWDTKLKAQIQLVNLALDPTGKPMPMDPVTGELTDSCKARCVDMKPKGDEIAVGFLDGSVRIYSYPEFKEKKRIEVIGKIASGKYRTYTISQVRYSPDSKYLAVGAHDFDVHIFNTTNYIQLKPPCSGSTSAVTHLDWAMDSQTIHTNDLSYEILYYNALTGQQDKGGNVSFKDTVWASWTLPMGWPVQGIWPAFSDGSDIDSVDKCSIPHPDGYDLVASGDDRGKVNVFRYPCTLKEAEPVIGKGHSSHVTNVMFGKIVMNQATYLFSTGGNDQCVFQWKITPKV